MEDSPWANFELYSARALDDVRAGPNLAWNMNGVRPALPVQAKVLARRRVGIIEHQVRAAVSGRDTLTSELAVRTTQHHAYDNGQPGTPTRSHGSV